VKNLIQLNRALLGKQLWKYATERKVLWRLVVDTIYVSLRGGWCSKEVLRPYSVALWKCIMKGWESFSYFVRYEVGDGFTVRFWYDLWCGEQSLKFSYSEL
jgi:hypothetical protein